MEFSKKKLLNIIQESYNEPHDVEMDEMAQPEKAMYRHIVYYEGKVHVGCKAPYCDNSQNKQQLAPGATLIGWMIFDVPVLFTDKKELEEFKNENPDVYSSLMEEHPEAHWINRQLGSDAPKPRNPEVVKPTGISDPTKSFEHTFQNRDRDELRLLNTSERAKMSDEQIQYLEEKVRIKRELRDIALSLKPDKTGGINLSPDEQLQTLRRKERLEFELKQVNKMLDELEVQTGKKYSPLMGISELIKRFSGGQRSEGFNRLVEDIIEKDDELQKHLVLCSIPPIKDQKTHVDRHTKFDNNSVSYTTHTFDAYPTQQDFLKSVVDRVRGRIPENDTSGYMARLFNKNYSNWSLTKTSEEKYFGVTDIYGLNRYGFREDQINAMVSSIFSIKGQRMGNSNGFTWTISLETKFGKKLQEEPKVKNLTRDKNIVVTKTAEPDPTDNRVYNESFTIMDKLSVKEALKSAFIEFKQKVMDISPEDALDLADIESSETLAEDLIKSVIKDLIK
jgi:hypothetical protein